MRKRASEEIKRKTNLVKDKHLHDWWDRFGGEMLQFLLGDENKDVVLRKTMPGAVWESLLSLRLPCLSSGKKNNAIMSSDREISISHLMKK